MTGQDGDGDGDGDRDGDGTGQTDRKTERQKDRKTERQTEQPPFAKRSGTIHFLLNCLTVNVQNKSGLEQSVREAKGANSANGTQLSAPGLLVR